MSEKTKLVISVSRTQIEAQKTVVSDTITAIENNYRPKFVRALQLLAEAFDDVVAAGFTRPVIVGGAAVEFYTGGAVTSGDFDVVTEAQRELEASLKQKGFERPGGPGALLRGLLHPALGIGVEVVSGALFDGASDGTRIRVITLDTGEVRVPPVEDMIADRMGQFCAPQRHDYEMLEQAIILYQIAKHDIESGLDVEYLDTRIRHETLGAYDLRFLSEKADEANA